MTLRPCSDCQQKSDFFAYPDIIKGAFPKSIINLLWSQVPLNHSCFWETHHSSVQTLFSLDSVSAVDNLH